MTHTVAVGEFEGPLGLLLELVERNRMEVTAISVARITEDYLKRIRELDSTPEELSDFLQLGARLLHIKSLALLPGAGPDEEQSEEIARLSLELEEYRRMQAAARELARRTSARSWHRLTTERLPASQLPPPRLELAQLAEAFSRALSRLEPVRESGLIREHISLEQMAGRLTARLESGGGFKLGDVLDACGTRLEIIVLFLALLELTRSGDARVSQAEQFGVITVEPASG
jgi:segregation and condensation protein A